MLCVTPTTNHQPLVPNLIIIPKAQAPLHPTPTNYQLQIPYGPLNLFFWGMAGKALATGLGGR